VEIKKNSAKAKIKISSPRGVRTGTLAKIFVKEKVNEQYGATTWARKAARFAIRSNLSDFDRFNVLLLRKKKSKLIGAEFAKLKHAKNGGGKKKAGGAPATVAKAGGAAAKPAPAKKAGK